VHRDDVHIALHYYRHPCLLHGLLGLKEAIEGPTLVIDRGLGRIDVLGL
jgi:hypothetical protein